ncbi:molybdate ABC transporter substrate-binding protein [Musicola paradisiaca]|uniref:Molybdate ABC transporter substrate-binding protein n=1 Tax=Musicola paradisiaca (strain Ech703) TaxID=579405 RepID=C6C319_MUSP7|nr:molybdate ABC transporter substrate-binding protein [Musicola paradisiaca]ACS85284.1 conserved hypothetical protein [Musicola paradisiaca Ech703]
MIYRPLRVFAAGSLRLAFHDLFDAFSSRYAIDIEPEFGPAGLLAQQLMDGASADVFASANREHPLHLAACGKAAQPMAFATNRLCITMRDDPELVRQHWLSALGDPRYVLSTSTPGSDPGGDYAQALFARIEQLHPGQGEALRQRAQALVGATRAAPAPSGVPAGAALILNGQSDMHIGYASYIPQMRRMGGVHIVELDDPYQITACYMLTTLLPVYPPAVHLARFICSDAGQAVLARHGFGPVLAL